MIEFRKFLGVRKLRLRKKPINVYFEDRTYPWKIYLNTAKRNCHSRYIGYTYYISNLEYLLNILSLGKYNPVCNRKIVSGEDIDKYILGKKQSYISFEEVV